MRTSTTRTRVALAAAAGGAGAAMLEAFRSRSAREGALQGALSSAETELESRCASGYRLAMNVARAVAANEKAFNLIGRIGPDDVAREMLDHVYESTMAIVCSTTDLIGQEGASMRHMKAIRTAVGPDADVALYDPDRVRPQVCAEMMLEARRKAESLLGICERYRTTRGLGWG